MEEAVYGDVLDVLVELRESLQEPGNEGSCGSLADTLFTEQSSALMNRLDGLASSLEAVLPHLAESPSPPVAATALRTLVTRKLGDVMESAHHIRLLTHQRSTRETTTRLSPSRPTDALPPRSSESLKARQALRSATQNLEDAQRLLRIAYPSILSTPQETGWERRRPGATGADLRSSPLDDSIVSNESGAAHVGARVASGHHPLHPSATNRQSRGGKLTLPGPRYVDGYTHEYNRNSSSGDEDDDPSLPRASGHTEPYLRRSSSRESGCVVDDEADSVERDRGEPRQLPSPMVRLASGGGRHGEKSGGQPLWWFDPAGEAGGQMAGAASRPVSASTPNPPVSVPPLAPVVRRPPRERRVSFTPASDGGGGDGHAGKTGADGVDAAVGHGGDAGWGLARRPVVHSDGTHTTRHTQRLPGDLWRDLLERDEQRLHVALCRDIMDLFNYGEATPQVLPESITGVSLVYVAGFLLLRFSLTHRASLTATDIDMRLGVYAFPELSALYEEHVLLLRRRELERTDPSMDSTQTPAMVRRRSPASSVSTGGEGSAEAVGNSAHDGSGSERTTSRLSDHAPAHAQPPPTTVAALHRFLQKHDDDDDDEEQQQQQAAGLGGSDGAAALSHHSVTLPGAHWRKVNSHISERVCRMLVVDEVASLLDLPSTAVERVEFYYGSLTVAFDLVAATGTTLPPPALVDRALRQHPFPVLRRVYVDICGKLGLDAEAPESTPALHTHTEEREDDEEDDEEKRQQSEPAPASVVPQPVLHFTLPDRAALDLDSEEESSRSCAGPGTTAMGHTELKGSSPRPSRPSATEKRAVAVAATAGATTPARVPAIVATTPTTATPTTTAASSPGRGVSPDALPRQGSPPRPFIPTSEDVEPDTLLQLSLQHGVSVAALREWNPHVARYGEEEPIPSCVTVSVPRAAALDEELYEALNESSGSVRRSSVRSRGSHTSTPRSSKGRPSHCEGGGARAGADDSTAPPASSPSSRPATPRRERVSRDGQEATAAPPSVVAVTPVDDAHSGLDSPMASPRDWQPTPTSPPPVAIVEQHRRASLSRARNAGDSSGEHAQLLTPAPPPPPQQQQQQRAPVAPVRTGKKPSASAAPQAGESRAPHVKTTRQSRRPQLPTGAEARRSDAEAENGKATDTVAGGGGGGTAGEAAHPPSPCGDGARAMASARLKEREAPAGTATPQPDVIAAAVVARQQPVVATAAEAAPATTPQARTQPQLQPPQRPQRPTASTQRPPDVQAVYTRRPEQPAVTAPPAPPPAAPPSVADPQPERACATAAETPTTPSITPLEWISRYMGLRMNPDTLTVRHVHGTAVRAGFRPGDVVRTMDGRAVRSVADLAGYAAATTRGAVFITVQEAGHGPVKTRHVTLDTAAPGEGRGHPTVSPAAGERGSASRTSSVSTTTPLTGGVHTAVQGVGLRRTSMGTARPASVSARRVSAPAMLRRRSGPYAVQEASSTHAAAVGGGTPVVEPASARHSARTAALPPPPPTINALHRGEGPLSSAGVLLGAPPQYPPQSGTSSGEARPRPQSARWEGLQQQQQRQQSWGTVDSSRERSGAAALRVLVQSRSAQSSAGRSRERAAAYRKVSAVTRDGEREGSGEAGAEP